MLPTKFLFILVKQFQRFLEIDQSETRIACGAMFVNGSGCAKQSL
jgi:hypothetical protein